MRPVDMPLMRDELVSAYSTYAGLTRQAVETGFDRLGPNKMKDHPWWTDALLNQARDELSRLKLAELFYVTTGMSELAQAAAPSLPQFTLMPDDLPAEFGLVLFEKPLLGENGSGKIAAATWGRTWAGGPGPALTITWWADYESHMKEPYITDQWRELAKSDVQLVAMISVSVPFSTEPVNDCAFPYTGRSYDLTQSGGGGYFIAAIKAVWILMGQSLASVDQLHYQRADHRRIQRQTGKSVPPVRVISLRRRDGGGDGSSDREYAHRWIVRGHWRQQWYPSREVHRPVWIAPHIKGPDGAPLLGGERVYALRR